MSTPITVLGGGLAGSEAAWQLARRGHAVRLVEMRPGRSGPAHHTGWLAELVCTNSLKSEALEAAHGALKAELALAGSLLLEVARATRVPAGQALAVDRELFSRTVTEALRSCPGVAFEEREATALPDPAQGLAVLASGPLTSPALAGSLAGLLGAEHLYFHDAIAPIVEGESVDRGCAFWATRYDKGDADYLNCPLSRAEYAAFYEALVAADRATPHAFEQAQHFEGCMPIEQIAASGFDSLRFGPLRPVGFTDPRDGQKPFALVQLRQEDGQGAAFNLVGFQTRLTQPEQRRVLRLIPALRSAIFLRYGSIHRNTYLDAPRQLAPDLALRAAPHVFVAGQLCGGEGYLEAVATGLLAALALAARLRGKPFAPPPTTTTMGGLLRHLQQVREGEIFAPSNVHWGLVDPATVAPPLGRRLRIERRRLLGERAVADFRRWWDGRGEAHLPAPSAILQPRGMA